MDRVKEVLRPRSRGSPENMPTTSERTCGEEASLRAEVESRLAPPSGRQAASWNRTNARRRSRLRFPLRPRDRCTAGSVNLAIRSVTTRFFEFIGAGGMGEVYRARDTNSIATSRSRSCLRHSRSIPIVLRAFEREAQVLASLNHPNIAAIYGLEEPDGVQALVLELVEGPTLASRIAGPMPVDEALSIGRQIAEASKPPTRGHRPSRSQARQHQAASGRDGQGAGFRPGEGARYRRQHRVTASECARRCSRISHAGLIFGTAAYMSPEQARGEL